ncbi:MAG: MarR family transcriptional regulator [Planctomycetes bacterium]|nr:MarR family transcriptional regulator [Planctomycetota bacterium]
MNPQTPSPRDLALRFTELYRSIYDRFHRRDRADCYRLTPESRGILVHLDRSGPLTVMEAAKHFDRSQSAMSELLDRLEQRGLIERIKDERDRRRTLVWLTPDGFDALEKSGQVLSVRLVEHALSQLDEPTRRRVIDSLHELLGTKAQPPGYKDD